MLGTLPSARRTPRMPLFPTTIKSACTFSAIEVIGLGARVLQAASSFTTEEGHQVYADPAGHPFCIGWGHPSPSALASFVSERFGSKS